MPFDIFKGPKKRRVDIDAAVKAAEAGFEFDQLEEEEKNMWRRRALQEINDSLTTQPPR